MKNYNLFHFEKFQNHFTQRAVYSFFLLLLFPVRVAIVPLWSVIFVRFISICLLSEVPQRISSIFYCSIMLALWWYYNSNTNESEVDDGFFLGSKWYCTWLWYSISISFHFDVCVCAGAVCSVCVCVCLITFDTASLCVRTHNDGLDACECDAEVPIRTVSLHIMITNWWKSCRQYHIDRHIDEIGTNSQMSIANFYHFRKCESQQIFSFCEQVCL